MPRTTIAALLISQRPGQVLFEVDPFRVRDVLILNSNSRASWLLNEVSGSPESREPLVIIPESPEFLLAAGMLGFLHQVLPDEVGGHERLGRVTIKADGQREVTIAVLDEPTANAVFTLFAKFAQAALVIFSDWAVSPGEVDLAVACGVHLAHTVLNPPPTSDSPPGS